MHLKADDDDSDEIKCHKQSKRRLELQKKYRLKHVTWARETSTFPLKAWDFLEYFYVTEKNVFIFGIYFDQCECIGLFYQSLNSISESSDSSVPRIFFFCCLNKFFSLRAWSGGVSKSPCRNDN